MIYLRKAVNSGLTHCDCPEGPITYPAQMDCPWCGCGFLFSCSNCGKAFMFAEGYETSENIEEIAERDLSRKYEKSPSKSEIDSWCEWMIAATSHIVPGREYAILDGSVFGKDARSIRFDGWHSRHSFQELPHFEFLSQLKNEGGTDEIIADRNYWLSRALIQDGCAVHEN